MKIGRTVRIVGDCAMIGIGAFAALLGVTELMKDRAIFAEEDAAEAEKDILTCPECKSWFVEEDAAEAEAEAEVEE